MEEAWCCRWGLGDSCCGNWKAWSQKNQDLVQEAMIFKVCQHNLPSPLKHSLSRTVLLTVDNLRVHWKDPRIVSSFHEVGWSILFKIKKEICQHKCNFHGQTGEWGCNWKWARRAAITDFIKAQRKAGNLVPYFWKNIKSKLHCEDQFSYRPNVKLYFTFSFLVSH